MVSLVRSTQLPRPWDHRLQIIPVDLDSLTMNGSGEYKPPIGQGEGRCTYDPHTLSNRCLPRASSRWDHDESSGGIPQVGLDGVILERSPEALSSGGEILADGEVKLRQYGTWRGVLGGVRKERDHRLITEALGRRVAMLSFVPRTAVAFGALKGTERGTTATGGRTFCNPSETTRGAAALNGGNPGTVLGDLNSLADLVSV